MIPLQKELGKTGEEKAARYLRGHGFTIIKTNFRCPYGEIDIIARKAHTLYFIEVKTRSTDNKGKPYESVTQQKINKLEKASRLFLLQNDYKAYTLRIGVVSIMIDGNNEDMVFYDTVH